MADLKSLKIAVAIVVLSLVGGMIHPDTRNGLLSGWRPSVKEALKTIEVERIGAAAIVTEPTASLRPRPGQKLVNWPDSAVLAAIESDDLQIKGVAARVSSLPPTDHLDNLRQFSKERIVWIKIREELLDQGVKLDPDNAFWWMEKAVSASIHGDDAGTEASLLRASECTSYNDFGWADLDLGRELTKELVGFPTQVEAVARAAASRFPHFGAQRSMAKRAIAGKTFQETAELRPALARLGLLVADDAQTMIGQLVGSSIHGLSLVKSAPGDPRIAGRATYYTHEEFESELARLGKSGDGAWRVLKTGENFTLPPGALADPSPLVLYGPTLGYATTWRALLCGLLMAVGLWFARNLGDSGWLGLVRPAFATMALLGYLINLTGRSGGKGVPELFIALCLVSAICLIFKRAHMLFPVVALALPQVIIQTGPARAEYILLGLFGSLLAIGSYLLAWKPDQQSSKWLAPTLPLLLLVMCIFPEMSKSAYSAFHLPELETGLFQETVNEPTFTPVFYWSLGLTALSTLACLQKERTTALAQAKTVALFTAILVASSVVYTGVMETESRKAIQQFKSETRFLERQIGEAMRTADYSSPAANNPAWKE